ncbi:hypothetical protein [Amaricoccus sp. W119]
MNDEIDLHKAIEQAISKEKAIQDELRNFIGLEDDEELIDVTDEACPHAG